MSANASRQYIAADAAAITPSDTVPNQFAYLYVGATGNVTVITENGTTVALTGVPTGQYIWLRTSYVKATGTTASNLVGFL